MAITNSIELLNMLVDAGIDREKAKPLAKEIMTRSEAGETLATKNDLKIELADTKSSIIQLVTALLIAQAGLTAALVMLIG